MLLQKHGIHVQQGYPAPSEPLPCCPGEGGKAEGPVERPSEGDILLQSVRPPWWLLFETWLWLGLVVDCRHWGWWRDSGSKSVRIVTKAHHLEQTQFPLEVIRARCGTLFNFSQHVHFHHPFRILSSLWIRNEKQVVVFSLKLLILLDLIVDQLSEKWSCKALPSLQFYFFLFSNSL